ncbi:hypothetical protein B0H14DRAFT_2639477 [Mycena olivaceomarginata]|nr:hypothetical protein B0H14DRAFT_2639477 [Mycena olivaceomarginata]
MARRHEGLPLLGLHCQNVHAFAHYTFGSSESSLVFADLQGTSGRVNGNNGVILFESHDTHMQRFQFDEKFPLELIADIPGPEPTEGSQSGDEMLNQDDADDADNDAVQENGD